MASDTKPQSKQPRLSYWPGLIEHYRRFLPVTDSTPVVTLNEGNTPLIEVRALADGSGQTSRFTLSSRAPTRPARSKTGA